MYELSDYQEVSRDFLADRTFACLFDVAGVGKTPPTIDAAWKKTKETGLPALVTCPAYLIDNWELEISRFAPGARVVKANGDGYEARRHSIASSEADFVLTSYNNWSAKWTAKHAEKIKEQYEKEDVQNIENWLRAQVKPLPRAGEYQYGELSKLTWAACIFDEGHRLRGRNSQGTKHVYELRRAKAANQSTPLWILTGTPIVNNPGDLYPLLHMWDRRQYKSYWNFVGEYCRVVKTPWSTDVGQLRPGMDEEFQNLLGGFSIRRTLEDVPSLASLESRSRDYLVDLPASVRKTIETARKEYIIEHADLDHTEFVSGGGALYAKLRQLGTVPPTVEKPKIEFCREFLEDHFGPVVIYTWYKNSAREVAESLVKTKRPVTVVTGDVDASKRGTLVDKWKTQKNGVLVATISSLKEGISLIHASDVIFLEHSELPADQEQCIARLKRRGQTSLVSVHNVFAKGSPDMAIRRHLNERTVGLKRALTTWLQEG
ncbi:MAG: DEAD/DEAH box helicase [Actinobacteria bacterium]|nr:DEAD/DEAH box helicase [Actinomycetota bacterium]